MPFTPGLFYFCLDSGEAGTTHAFTSGTPFSETIPNVFGGDAFWTNYHRLGGSITAAAGQVPGTYTGTISVSISYQ